MSLLVGIVKFVLKFAFTSFLIFTLAYSVVTKEFPPNPSHFKQTLASFGEHPAQNFQMLQNYLVKKEAPSLQEPPSAQAAAYASDEAEIEKLAALYEKRAEIFQGKTGSSRHIASTDDPAASVPAAPSANEKALRHEVEALKARVLTLEDQLEKLQKNPRTRK